MTVTEDKEADNEPVASGKGHMGKKLLVKDKLFSKIRFTRAKSPAELDINKEDTIVKVQMIKDPDKPALSTTQYRVYPQRWWILSTVVMLNLANYSHWVAFPSVAKTAAKHYDQDGETMDLIPTVSYGLGVPCCLLATYIVERWGLRAGLHIGGILTGIGGLMCCLSTLPYLSDDLSNDNKFYLALIGQALTGVACPFISCVPTKISQHWFSDEQRTLATIFLGMSNPMGIVLGQFFTPLFVREPSDVPMMNIIWFIPAGLGSILTIWKVNNNIPPTPPSHSAWLAQQMNRTRGKEYWPSIKKLFTSWPFIVMFLFLGGAMGYVSTISTKIEQVLCSRGYSDQLAGLSGSLILFCGFLASFPFGVLSYKLKRPILLCKISGIVVITALVMIGYFMRIPNQGPAIIVSCILLGIFAIGSYPIALELLVECTYPVDQAIGTAFMFLSSALQGVLLMVVENSLGYPLTEEEMKIQSCVALGEDGHQQPKDYSSYLNFITIYMLVLSALFMLCFKTEMKRANADELSKKVLSAENNASSSNHVREIESAESQALVEESTSSESTTKA